MGIDHGGFDVFVTKQLLNGTDIVAALKKVGGEGVAEGVRGDMFIDLCKAGGFFDDFLHGGFVEVVTTGNSSTRVFGEVGGGEEVLPDPVFVCIGVFAIQGIGQVDRAEAVRSAKSFGCVSFELKVMRLSGKVSLDKPLQEKPHGFQLTRDYTRYTRRI